MLLIANWKMNPETEQEARAIVSGIVKSVKAKGIKVVILPPFVFLSSVAKIVSGKAGFALGAQDVSYNRDTAHTGAVSATMLKKSGVHFVLVGHSDMRKAGDTPETVREKIRIALQAGIKTVLCIGEPEKTESGEQFLFLKEQLHSALLKLPNNTLKNLVIAYEPVWAIGKSAKSAMHPEQVRETTIFIRRELADLFGTRYAEKIPVLYGGSVTDENARAIVEEGGTDGLLVGRESLRPADLAAIAKQIK